MKITISKFGSGSNDALMPKGCCMMLRYPAYAMNIYERCLYFPTQVSKHQITFFFIIKAGLKQFLQKKTKPQGISSVSKPSAQANNPKRSQEYQCHLINFCPSVDSAFTGAQPCHLWNSTFPRLRNCLTENASMNLRKASSTANCILGRINLGESLSTCPAS